jgi:hypothetical protein
MEFPAVREQQISCSAISEAADGWGPQFQQQRFWESCDLAEDESNMDARVGAPFNASCHFENCKKA